MSIIEEFIEQQTESVKPYLTILHQTIRELLPDAKEKIAYGIPTYYRHKNIIHIGPGKNHVGLYPGSKPIEHFKERLVDYKTSKGTIQFPLTQPLPLPLIKEIIIYASMIEHER